MSKGLLGLEQVVVFEQVPVFLKVYIANKYNFENHLPQSIYALITDN